MSQLVSGHETQAQHSNAMTEALLLHDILTYSFFHAGKQVLIRKIKMELVVY